MKMLREISDDQIRVIGKCKMEKPSPRYPWKLVLLIIGIVIASMAIGIATYRGIKGETESQEESEPAYFEPVQATAEPVARQRFGKEVDSQQMGFTEIRDTVINDIPIKIYIPHNAELSLHIGRIDRNDTTIVFTAQAADVRADNGGIVGAFVLKGEPRAWGLSKKGYCASINGTVTIGMAENSPLFEEATEQEGYFFRQYPLVSDGRLIENEQKGKSIRRAICSRIGEIFMVETGTEESFHDFAQALVDLGIDQAVSLVGSAAYGWAVDEDNLRHEFGNENMFKGYRRIPKNTSYIIWRRKQE